jgi:hypothetical protein
MAPFKPRAIYHCLPNWQAATSAAAANGWSVTGHFPFDMNIFRPHDFPLASGKIDAAPVNHPALVKTSDQPLFRSSNSAPFTSAEALRSSYISPVPSLK